MHSSLANAAIEMQLAVLDQRSDRCSLECDAAESFVSNDMPFSPILTVLIIESKVPGINPHTKMVKI